MKTTQSKPEILTYTIPVEWSVYDTIEVKAKSFSDAVKWAKENSESIPLGTNSHYIDGSWCIDGEQECSSHDEHVKYLESNGYGKGYSKGAH